MVNSLGVCTCYLSNLIWKAQHRLAHMLWRQPRSVPVVEYSIEFIANLRHLVRNDIPKNVVVEPEVAVGKHVSERCDSPPFNLRMPIGDFGRDLLCSLP